MSLTRVLKKRIKIKNATAFKLEYFDDDKKLKTKEFLTYKAMEQFHSRQTDFFYIDNNRFAFIGGKWHRFIKLKSPIVFEEDLAFINKTFNEKIEESNLQNEDNEDLIPHVNEK